MPRDAPAEPARTVKRGWPGSYYLYLPGGEIGGLHIGWEYTLRITREVSIFGAEGYQCWFTYYGKVQVSGDSLYFPYDSLRVGKSLSPITHKSDTYIIRHKGQYYLQSSELAIETQLKPDSLGYLLQKIPD